jgi:hypothetical protein
MMRVMVLVQAETQGGAEQWDDASAADDFEAMRRFNEVLVEAGVMLAGEGLAPTSEGKRVRFDGQGSSSVVDGPFAEAKEVVGGYWIWQVSSMDEAVEWIKRAPFRDGTIELRRVQEEADFADILSPDALEAEARLREQIRQQGGADQSAG